MIADVHLDQLGLGDNFEVKRLRLYNDAAVFGSVIVLGDNGLLA